MSERQVAPGTILEAMTDPRLFARWFAGESWAAWRAFLAALFALPTAEAECVLYERHTGRAAPPAAPAREAWAIVGRRGGKSRIAALVGVFLACFRDYDAVLAPGERGLVMLLAADRRQARVILGYVAGLLESTPLGKLLQRRTKDSLHLANRITIEVQTASFRLVRGHTVVAAVLDEVAFWRSEESANPDVEILHAIRPAMATIPSALLLGISSPYARRGVLWEAHRRHFGKDDDRVLVWQASTRAMNPSVDETVIAEAYARDEAAAAAEYGAEFRRDVETFVSREAVETCVVPDRHELPAVGSLRYVAFCDPSGGSQDAMTLAIAHSEDCAGRAVAVLDCVRERRPPFSLEDVVREFAETLRAYGCHQVAGDRYAGEWPRERFAAYGIGYEPSARAKSDLYRELLPLINSKAVELLDERRLLAQLLGLERRTARGGRDTIDHGPHGHDDVINAAAGALVAAHGMQDGLQIYAVRGDESPIDSNRGWRAIPDVTTAFLQGR